MEVVESRRIRKKRETKDGILKAAREIFDSKGYENSSIEDIIKQVDISKATFFNYFPSKESLLLGIANHQTEDFKEFFKTIDKSEQPLRKKIEQMIEWVFFDSIKYLHLNSRIAYTCFPKNEEEVHSTYIVFKQSCKKIVQQAVEVKEIVTSLSIDDIVNVISVYCCGLIFDCYYLGTKQEARKRFDVTLKVLLQGLGYQEENR